MTKRKGTPRAPLTPRPKEHTTEQIAQAAGRTLGYTQTHWHTYFLNALRLKPSVTAACKVAKVARRTAYWHRENHEEFAKDWDDALEEGRDLIEEGMIEAARAGDTKAAEYLLTKWRYGQNITGKNKKSEEPQTITVAWGKD